MQDSEVVYSLLLAYVNRLELGLDIDITHDFDRQLTSYRFVAELISITVDV